MGARPPARSSRPDLSLTVDGAAQALVLDEAGLTFPAGVGGLSTMRLVCGFDVTLAAPLGAGSRIAFADRSSPERLGWREIVATGSGVTWPRRTASCATASPSNRLTAYPTDLLTQALDDAAVTVVATPGGPTLAAFDIPDATPLAGAAPVAAVAGPSARPGARCRRPRPPSAIPAAAGRVRAGRRRQRRPAVDLPRGRPHAVRPARVAPDRRRARGGPRPDARPRQDPDGGLPRRDARDAAPRGRPRAVGDAVAHARDPGARRASWSAPEGSCRRTSWSGRRP